MSRDRRSGLAGRWYQPASFDYSRVAALDPLRLDSQLPRVWAANSAADLRGLVGLLDSLITAAPEPATWSVFECMAAMRDLGIVMGSIKRFGAEPVEVVPGLEPLLLYLGERSGMVPRDTVHHYAGCNPAGARERSYTGNRNETMLISAVRISLPRLNAGVEVCQRLTRLDPNDLDFVIALNELVALLSSLEASIDTALANVDPEFFARVLRPFYCDIRVGDHRYLGPSGAHVPLSLIDLALWAGGQASSEYAELWRESVKYGLPGWRELSERWARGGSLVSRVEAALTAAEGTAATNLVASAEALARALRILVKFRGKHLPLARKAYTTDAQQFPTGSGGATVELLAWIVDLTKANAALARDSFTRYSGRRVNARRDPAH